VKNVIMISQMILFVRIEIVKSSPGEDQDPYIHEDESGNVVFDSTNRPIRFIFAGSFLVIGFLIGGLIYFLSDDVGFFEYFFVIGWTCFCLFSMGFIYEVVINRIKGTAVKKTGWFFIRFNSYFELMDFKEILVESTFFRQRYDTVSQRQESKGPKFKVYLNGKKGLTIRVFSHMSEARKLGMELARYLDLPVLENSHIQS